MLSNINKIRDLSKILLNGYNPFIKKIEVPGQFFLQISKKFNIKDFVVVIDNNTNKWNQIISELIFLDRKAKINLDIINVKDQKGVNLKKFEEKLVVSFVEHDIIHQLPGAFLFKKTYTADSKAVFSGKFTENYYIYIFDRELYKILHKEDEDIKYTRILAIITCYNEEDIIAQTVNYLTDQGIQVHVIDNWSTDNSSKIIEKLTFENSLVTSEKYPASGPVDTYNWKDILTRVQEYAMQKSDEFDWFVHHDADEIRESPFENFESLRDGIQIVDDLGYNAIDYTVVNFELTKDGFTGKQKISEYFNCFSFGKKKHYHHKQIKTWKSQKIIDLATSGGHEVIFKNRQVFPYKFLLKHYPIRSVEQAKRKVFRDRKARWNKEERKNKWHTQYDEIDKDYDFLKSPDSCIKFDRKEIYKKYLIKLIFGK